MAARNRFELFFGRRPRDRRIARWIDDQMAEGRDVSEIVKNILDELITGKSVLSGKPVAVTAGSQEADPDDETAEKLRNFGD